MVRKTTNHKKTARKKKQPQKWQFTFSVELIGVILAFFSFIGGFRLGYVGRMLSNLFRFMVGNTDQVLFAIFAMYGLFLIIKGKELTIQKRFLVGGVLAYGTTLLLLHALSFSAYASEVSGIINETLHHFVIDFQSNQITTNLGGGMIGALLYTASRFLVAQIGTMMLVFLSYGLTILVLIDLPFADLIHGARVQWNKLFGAKSSTPKETTARLNQLIDQTSIRNSSVTKQETSRSTNKKSTLIDRLKELVFDGEEDIETFEQPRQSVNRTEQIDIATNEQMAQPLVANELQEYVPESSVTSKAELKEENNDKDDEPLVDFVIEAQPEDEDYQLPPLSLLNPATKNDQSDQRDIVKRNVQILEDTFKSFGVDAKVIDEPLLGPAVTKFEIKPAVGVKVSKIVNLSDDIALALAAKDIRIEAPIPGKPYIGIEVPNAKTSFISFSDVIQTSLRSNHILEVPLGRDISGQVRLADLTKMPHMLIAGSTGSGKSVCINGIITSILMKAKPNEVKLMMIDPKMVELNVYNGIPHLLTPVVTNPRKAAQALQKVVAEMEKRYEMFAAMGMRNIDGYNAHVAQYNLETGEDNPLLPFIVVIVDELADLMMVASNEVEDAIIRLAQMARAAGIHMVLATQRPSVDVITGIIKANVPSRIAFAVSSGTDSRTIIDTSGAEKLLGRGDMLYMPMGENKPIRVQGAYLTDAEVENVVQFVKQQKEAEYDESMMPSDTNSIQSSEPEDELFEQVIEMLKDQETVSTSFLQRRFRIGYNRAARLIDDLEMRGYIGAADGSRPRKVNIQNLLNNLEQTPDENVTESAKDEHLEQ